MAKFELDDLDIVVSAEALAEATERIDYDVHMKYVTRIGALSDGLSITHSLRPAINTAALRELDPKLRIIERTNTLLEGQVQLINDDAEYAQACVGWLPAQVYYNLYHLLAIIEYMVTGQKVDLRISHQSCLKKFASRLADGTVRFSCPIFNQVCDKNILKFRSKSGEVLSNSITDERLLSLVMKKIATDKLEDFKARCGLNCHKKADRQRYTKEVDGLKISVVDFFYSMRIRTNYRDMSFLDDLDANRTRVYFLQYYETANKFYNCLNDFKNDLIARVQ